MLNAVGNTSAHTVGYLFIFNILLMTFIGLADLALLIRVSVSELYRWEGG